MKYYIDVFMRFLLEIMLLSFLTPFIILVLVLTLINYILMFVINKGTILDALKVWSNMIKKGIYMNIDFIFNGL